MPDDVENRRNREAEYPFASCLMCLLQADPAHDRDNQDIVKIAGDTAEGSTLGLESGMPVDVTNETPAAARMQLYQTQSCLFITTRILVVDFLVHRLQPSQVNFSFLWLPGSFIESLIPTPKGITERMLFARPALACR
jgi:hypothetical protein